MARNSRDDANQETEDPNLAPFMNLVVILIPLLLLSVIFVKIGVINITAPKLSVGPPSEQKEKEEEKEKLNLTVTVGDKGFQIAATGGKLPPMEGCAEDGPTICLADNSANVEDLVNQAREQFAAGNTSEGKAKLEQAMGAYDWKRLYNEMIKLKDEFPEETVFNVSADPNIPYSFIVRLMDVARYKLEEDSYESSSEFWSASYRKSKSEKSRFARLFSDPVLSVAK